MLIFIYVSKEEKKYHIIYKTTCLINKKYYIGMHSTDDLDRFVETLINVLPLERTKDEAIVLVGHNNAGGGNDQVFNDLAGALKQRDHLIFTATLKGALDFDSVRRDMVEHGVKKAYLLPLLIAVGGHALKDLAGDGEAAWRVRS